MRRQLVVALQSLVVCGKLVETFFEKTEQAGSFLGPDVAECEKTGGG